MKKRTVVFLWISLAVFVIAIMVFFVDYNRPFKIRDNDPNDVTAEIVNGFCFVAALYIIISISLCLSKDIRKKKAGKRFEGQPIYGLPDKGRFKVVVQGRSEEGVFFLVLRNLANGVILSYCSGAKLLDQNGNVMTDKVPEKFKIQKHAEIEIDREGKLVSSDDVYYIFPLEEE